MYFKDKIISTKGEFCMSDQSIKSVIEVAAIVMKTMDPLNDEDKQRVLTSIAALFNLHLPNTKKNDTENAGNDSSEQVRNDRKKTSLVEILKEKVPATNLQRIAVFAYFKEKYEGKDRFTKSEILPMFAAAKLPKPGNFDRDFSTVIKEGWIHEDGSECYLTATGEEVVESGFQGKGKPRGVSTLKKSKKVKSESV